MIGGRAKFSFFHLDYLLLKYLQLFGNDEYRFILCQLQFAETFPVTARREPAFPTR